MSALLQIKSEAVVAVGSEAESAALLALSRSGLLLTVSQPEAVIRARDLVSGREIYRALVPPAAGQPLASPGIAVTDDGGRYLLANYTRGQGEAVLWASDLEANRHWPVGAEALQLCFAGAGQWWGVAAAEVAANPHPRGPRLGRLFRYKTGSERAEEMPAAGPVALVTPAPGRPDCLFLVGPGRMILYDYARQTEVTSVLLVGLPRAAAVDEHRNIVWFTLPGNTLYGAWLQANGEIAAVIVGDHFGPADRGFFYLPQSGWLAAVSDDGTVSVYDPDSQRALRVPGPIPQGAGPASATDADVWYFAGRQVTRCTLEAGSVPKAEAFLHGQTWAASGSLRLAPYDESMRMLLRRTAEPAFQSEIMCPEAVDPRGPETPPGPARLPWNRSMQGVHWQAAAEGWFELREDFDDFGYLSRVRLNPDGLRLDMELTAYNYGSQEISAVHFAPCAGLSGDLVDMRHRRTYVVDGEGRLALLGPLAAEFPYVAASVRGGRPYRDNPKKPSAFRFLDLQLSDKVIIVRALDGRAALAMAFENAGAIEALFVPCVHCDTYVEHVPPGGSATVRGFVAWVPGDEQTAFAYYQSWLAALD